MLLRKLNVLQSVNYVDFKKYVTELGELVKESYEDNLKNIDLEIHSAIARMSDDKALPLGLIIVELISNSMKYAFKNQNSGKIAIVIDLNSITQQNILHYSDNGIRFDFNSLLKKALAWKLSKA